MYGVVKIGDKEVPMLAMASVDVYYKRIFGEDPLKMQIKEGFDSADAVELFQRRGFVMAKFAKLKVRKEMLKLTEDNYLDWLDGFERSALIDAVGDIECAGGTGFGKEAHSPSHVDSMNHASAGGVAFDVEICSAIDSASHCHKLAGHARAHHHYWT